MAHVRKQIRDAIKTALTGLSTTGANCYQSRVFPFESTKLPALLIYTKSETTDFDTISLPRDVMRVLEINVEAYVQGTANYDNTLDQIAVEVEEAIAADVTLGGLTKDLQTVAFEADFSGDGEQTVAIGRFTISATYRTLENDVETAA